MPDDKKKFIPKPKADAWRFDASPLVYNYDNYLNSLGYRAGISSKNFLHKPSPGGLYYPMSLNFNQSYADNSRAYNADPSKFENPQEVISNMQFGQPTTYSDYTRGAREADMGVDFKVGATNMNPSPKWDGAYASFDLGAGYSKLRQGYGNVEGGGGYKFPTKNGFSGSAGAYLKAIVQNKDLYGTLQDRVIPGQPGHIVGNVDKNKATWGYGLKGDFNYSHPHDNWTVGARGSIMADLTQGKNNYRFPDAADSNRVEQTPVINAELYAQYPLNYGISKAKRKLEEVKKNDIAPKDKDDKTPSEIEIERLRKISIPNKRDEYPEEFHVRPVSFGMGDEYPNIYKGDNGSHSLFGNVIMPGDVREFKNGGQFDRKFNLPEDSFRRGGNGLHDSIYSSSLEQYPAVYAKGGHMNFKSNAAYKAWLGYGHASGAFERTPGNQAVSVQGHPHHVQHEMGGFLGNPYVNMFDGGGTLNIPSPKTLGSMTVPERTALIYQAVTQYVSQAKADGRLAPNENLNVEGIVGQILLETGNGTSSLVKRANNFGGIKADANWNGPKSGVYRAYATPEEGLKAQVDFYLDNPRYRKNGVFNATTPQEHFEAVQRAGYAEAKDYVSAGMGMVKSIKPRLAKVDMSKFNIPASTLTSEAAVTAPPISEEEIAQGMQPINRLGIRPLQPLNILPDINTAPEIVPYTTGASAQNQMPNLTSEAPSIPKGWFGGNNGLFGGNRQKKFAQGGLMNQLTEFNEGGSHEENPLGGIPQGMNQNGGMNLVQQGETKNNTQDFIYSDDITISKGIAKQFNINSRFVGKTYADASKKANRTDSRRETDTIEQNAIAKDLDKLAQAQETQKQEELQKDIAKMTEKHPEFMTQMMQAQQQPPMGQPSPEEMAMMQQQGQMAPAMQGQGMDPAMMEQMQIQQGMRYGGPMSYKYGGNMYDFGGFMKENDDAFTQAGAGALKSAGKGAAMGATIGSIIPGVGNVIGAGIGALAGGVGGAIKGGIEGHKQDEAEYKAKIDAANRERLTGIQTEIPQEASNNTLAVLGQAAVQGGTEALGAFAKTPGAPTSGGGTPVMDNAGNQITGTGDAYSWDTGNMPTMPNNMVTAGMQDTSYQGFRNGGYMHNAGPMGQPLTNLYAEGGFTDIEGPGGPGGPGTLAGAAATGTATMGATALPEVKITPPKTSAPAIAMYNPTLDPTYSKDYARRLKEFNNNPMDPKTGAPMYGSGGTDAGTSTGTGGDYRPYNAAEYGARIKEIESLNAAQLRPDILEEYLTLKSNKGFYVSAHQPDKYLTTPYDLTKYTPPTSAALSTMYPPAPDPNALKQNYYTDANTGQVVKDYDPTTGQMVPRKIEGLTTGSIQYSQPLEQMANDPARLAAKAQQTGQRNENVDLLKTMTEEQKSAMRAAGQSPRQFLGLDQEINSTIKRMGGNLYNRRFDGGGLMGDNNEGVVLTPDGSILTGTGDLYNWNTNNTPTLENPQTSYNSSFQQEKTTKEEEKKKNQFSDFKTDQDAMKDKFSMNETLGQFVGSNLGAGYNLYQGIFGKKSKVPSTKDMFTPVDPYRMNINPQLRAAEETYAGAARGLMNAAPSGGAYLTNRAILAASEAATRAGIMAQAENAYGTSKMQTDMFNSQGKSQAKLKEYELKSAIDAAKQNYLQAGLQGINESINAQKANQAALIYASMHGGGEYGVEANPYLQQIAMEYQKRREAKKAQKTSGQ